MVYEVEIEGTLPTFGEWANEGFLYGRIKALKKRESMIESLIPLFADLPKFDGHAYIGIVWVRPDSKEKQSSVCYAKTLILSALRRASIVRSDYSLLTDLIDLGFLFNARNPRTIVCIADSLDELYAHQESRYA